MFDSSFFAGEVTESRLREWAGEQYFARGPDDQTAPRCTGTAPEFRPQEKGVVA